jgi:hypothetical protein
MIPREMEGFYRECGASGRRGAAVAGCNRVAISIVITPILEYVLEMERKHSDRYMAVVISNLVEKQWYRRFMYNKRGELPSALLLLNGNHRTTIVNVPWYLHE